MLETPMPDALRLQLEALPVEAFAPGASLVAPDAQPAHLHFIRRGLVRLYSLAPDGSSYNHGFHGPGEWVFGRIVMGDKGPCCGERALGVEALQATEAVRVSLAQLERWRAGDSAIGAYLMGKLMAIAAQHLAREADLAQRPAEARYLELLGKQPALADSVPQHQIAAWLGITPVALSRIRRRLREQGKRP